jgi:hypothetical protein
MRFWPAILVLICGTLSSIAREKAGAPRPVIQDQPIGRSVTETGPVALSVIPVGTDPLTYQWWKDGQALTNNTRVTGATNSVLSIVPTQLADSGSYSVVLTSTGGSTTSSVASVVINQLVFGLTPVGSTGAVITIPGQPGDVCRVEVSVNFGNYFTNGFATNYGVPTQFLDVSTNANDFRRVRVRYDRLLPVLISAQRGDPYVARVYGRLGEAWRIDASSDLAHWGPLDTVTNVNGWVKIVEAADSGRRFYRISVP